MGLQSAIQVTPELPDLLTYRSVEQRILRACKTIRALPDKETKWIYHSHANTFWHQVVRDWDAYGSEEEPIRFRPSPFDVGDCLEALKWVKVLEKHEFKLIWWRSFDNVSFGIIAGRIGRSDETARRRYEDALRKVWNAALEDHYHAKAPVRV